MGSCFYSDATDTTLSVLSVLSVMTGMSVAHVLFGQLVPKGGLT